MTPPITATTDQRIKSIVIGIVLDVNDPDETGRVQVALPWYASGYEEWARVSQLYAGKGFGSTWVPEVDSEVLVAFLHGDMRFPYVLGALHGKVDTPPYARSAGQDIKAFVTPAGLEMLFDDSDKSVTVKTKSGAELKLTDAGEITVTASTSIELHADQSLKLSSAEIAIEATGSVTVSGATIALN